MNPRQTELYRNLMALVSNNEAFYHQDFTLGGHIVRIFNYRLASYTDFCAPDALECRGHMFNLDSEKNVVEMLSWPPEKFFNYRENDFTMDLDLTQVDEVYDKLDGSLISSYVIDGQLMLKSKGSVSSDQAQDAMKWLMENPAFCERIRTATVNGFTVNCEWIGQNNRIVIGYSETCLKVLSVRSRTDGSYVSYNDVLIMLGVDNVVQRKAVSDPHAFVESVPDMTDDIEGFVVKMKTGQRFKLKTTLYKNLHHCKDSVNNPRRLFEAILDEGIDDLRSLFYTDVVAMKMIDEMQDFVNHKYNHMVALVETFYAANKHLDRKDYAVKGQSELDRLYFGLAMTMYLGKAVDFKAFMKSKYKELGIRDTQLEGASNEKKQVVTVDLEVQNSPEYF